MKNIPVPKKIIYLAFVVISFLTVGRLFTASFDASYFIVAGSRFVDSSQTLTPIVMQKGDGYDGQYFYRYALHPFNFDKQAYGINVDIVPYRIQRIAYPFITWVLSFGGNALLVPWMLILVNILAFVGIFFYTNKLIDLIWGIPEHGYLPLLLCGIYMSFSRDLSEVVELFFFTATIYYVFSRQYLFFSIFATFTLFSRDTSLIVLFPLSLLVSIRIAKDYFKLKHIIYLWLPFLLFGFWKLIILHNTQSAALADGYQKMGLPFEGIIDGFRYNLDFSDIKHFLQFDYWIAYLLWNVYLAIIVFRLISFKSLLKFNNENILNLLYVIWFLFSLIITLTIYIDDWGFVRIFSLWNMIGFMIIIVNKFKISRPFIIVSIVLVFLTIARLIVRV